MLAGYGWIEVIVGGMFSGKTEELIKRIRRSVFAKQPVQVFKPKIDNRYHQEDVTSHNQNRVKSQVIEHIDEVLELLSTETKVVAIDEAQFFSADLVRVCETLAERGLRVIVAGLDTDWQGKPFGPMPELMAISENVTKQHAVCVVCGEAASRTQRIGKLSGQVAVGSVELYEARCRLHFVPREDEPTRASLN